jgi:holliday junction DNA helicase RuvA
MIGWLKGKILKKHPPFLLLDVNGVGYEIEASMTTFYRLPEEGAEISLHTHLTVREDAHLLFGFYQESERKLFRTLIKVNGVGPKLALTLLSSMEPQGFVESILSNDTVSLVRIPGVGKKTAERLIVEMRDKLDAWKLGDEAASDGDSSFDSIGCSAASDAMSALEALGYKSQDAKKLINKLLRPGLSTEELVREALQQL